MSDVTPNDIGKTLQELSTSSLRYIREGVADRLGRLRVSSEEIVRVLAVAAALDGDAAVRRAALQALQAPVHQAFLKDHPNLIQEATDSATQDRAKAKQVEDLAIRAEYLRRRTRERIHYLILFCGMLAFWVLMLVGLVQERMELWMVRVWQVGFIGATILIFYLSWHNWRCPACEAWLGGVGYHINPLWSPDSVRCPNCGERLL